MQAYISAHWITISIPVAPVTHTDVYRDLQTNSSNNQVLDRICLDLINHSFAEFKTVSPRHGYKHVYTLADLVYIYIDGYGHNNGTACIEFTGDAVDTFGLDVATIGMYALDRGGNVCRIDVQCLDTGNYIPYQELVKCCGPAQFKQRVRTRWNRGNKVTDLPRIETQPYRRITFGSPKSDNYLVIYDRQTVEELDFPCTNLEMRITNRDDCAALVRALSDGEADQSAYFAGLLRGKIEFLKCQPDRRKDYRDTAKWWSDFLGSVQVQKLRREPRNTADSRSRYTNIALAKARKQVERLVIAGDVTALQQMQAQIDEQIKLLNMTF